MLLLSIEWLGPDAFAGYVEDGDLYKGFFVERGKDARIDESYKKEEFNDYEHFRAVIGKFDPYAVFLADPIPITDLSWEVLNKACEQLPEGYTLQWEE
jgi:hypothetical protein